MRKFLLILPFALLITSCEPEEFDDTNNSIDFSDNSFSFIETIVFDDYPGESRTNIYDIDNDLLINLDVQTSFLSRAKWINRELIYSDDFSIKRYNPKSKEITVLFEPERSIQNYDYMNEQIVYSDYNEIYLFDLKTESLIHITENIEGEFRTPQFSPDGNSILFNKRVNRIRDGDNAPTRTTQFMVYKIGSKAFQEVQMFDEFASPNNEPSWSPGSNEILYSQFEAVFIYNLDLNKLTRVTDEDIVARNPVFSPDGNMMSYFSSTDNSNDLLTIYDFDTQTNKIISNVSSYQSSWHDKSDRILFCTDDGIYQFNLSNNDLTKMIEGNKSIALHSTQWIR
ncbi:MAG: PD40 domain-containing protein [Cyclobacteriaceae bacterium]